MSFEASRVQQWLNQIPESKTTLSDLPLPLRRKDLEKLIEDSKRLGELEKRRIPDLEYSIALTFSYQEQKVHYTVPESDLESVKNRLEGYKRDFPSAYIAVRFGTGEYTRLNPEVRSEDDYDEW